MTSNSEEQPVTLNRFITEGLQAKRELNKKLEDHDNRIKDLEEKTKEFIRQNPHLLKQQPTPFNGEGSNTTPEEASTSPETKIPNPSQNLQIETSSRLTEPPLIQPTSSPKPFQTMEISSPPKSTRSGCFSPFRETARNARVWMQKHHLWK